MGRLTTRMHILITVTTARIFQTEKRQAQESWVCLFWFFCGNHLESLQLAVVHGEIKIHSPRDLYLLLALHPVRHRERSMLWLSKFRASAHPYLTVAFKVKVFSQA